jgi:hypothetical protein
MSMSDIGAANESVVQSKNPIEISMRIQTGLR